MAKGEGSLYQKKSTNVWMFSLMENGKRVTRSLGTTDKDEAEKKLRQIRKQVTVELLAEKADEPVSAKTFTVEQLLGRYLQYLEDNNRESLSVARQVIGKIQRDATFRPIRKVHTLTTKDFEDYRRRHVGAGVTHRTVNYRFSLIRAALRLESKRTPSDVGKVPYIPFVTEKNARDGFLEYSGYPALLAEMPQSLKALVVVAYHSGCRLGELLRMKWVDVDWNNRVIRLPKTKNGRKRNLPFWGGIEESLKQQREHRDTHFPTCEHLFFWHAVDCGLSHGGVRLAPGAPIRDFRASWQNAVARAHTADPSVKPDLLFHDLRRSGVRLMVQEAGIPESQAMLISGHETRSMLERYNIVSLKNVQDAGAKLDDWSKQQTAKV